MFKRHVIEALNKIFQLLVRPEVVKQLDKMILAGAFQLNYPMLCCAVFLVYSNVWDSGIRTGECQKVLSKFYYLKVMDGIHKTNIIAFLFHNDNH